MLNHLVKHVPWCRMQDEKNLTISQNLYLKKISLIRSVNKCQFHAQSILLYDDMISMANSNLMKQMVSCYSERPLHLKSRHFCNGIHEA